MHLTEFFVVHVQKGKCASFFTEVAVNTLQKPSQRRWFIFLAIFLSYSEYKLFANCWSSAAGIFSMFLCSSSLLRNSLNMFRSDTVFFFVLPFSWSSVNDAISYSVNLTNLLLALFIPISGECLEAFARRLQQEEGGGGKLLPIHSLKGQMSQNFELFLF